MSSGPRTVVDVSMCRAGAALKVGSMYGSGGAMPLFHVGTFLGTYPALSISLLIRRCMLLMERWNDTGASFLIQPPRCSLGEKDQVTERY